MARHIVRACRFERLKRSGSCRQVVSEYRFNRVRLSQAGCESVCTLKGLGRARHVVGVYVCADLQGEVWQGRWWVGTDLGFRGGALAGTL